MQDLLDAPHLEGKLYVALMAKRAKYRDHDSPAFTFCKKDETGDCLPIPEVRLPEKGDFDFTTPTHLMGSKGGPPCGEEKARCPVQLIWIKGVPNLRFCIEPKKPGYIVPVKDPDKAQRLSTRACRQWKDELGTKPHPTKEGKTVPDWPKRFFDRNYPKIKKMAVEAHPMLTGQETPWGPGLGEQERSPLPFLFGALGAGLVAGLAFLRKREES